MTSTPKHPSIEQRMCAVSEDVLFYAFRYALGRMTYSVKQVCDDIRMNIGNISKQNANTMLKEIVEAEKEPDGLGMDMDREEWVKVKELLIKKVGVKI